MRSRNDGATVQRALESVVSQGLESFEIIAVDCASADRTPSIIDSFAERDVRIDALHAESTSGMAALNLALGHARGTYIAFLDANSWFSARVLERALERMRSSALELLILGMSVDTVKADGSVSAREVCEPGEVFVSQHEFRTSAWRFFEAGQMGAVSGKIFQRVRIEELGLRFDDSACGEQGFVTRYLRDVERVGVFGEVALHVPPAQVPELGQGDYAALPAQCDRMIELLLDLYHHWGLDGDPVSMDVVRNRYLERVVACIGSVCSPGCSLPAEEKHRIVVELIGSKHARLAASATKKPKSMLVSAMAIPIKSQNVKLAMGGAAVLMRLFGRRASLPLAITPHL